MSHPGTLWPPLPPAHRLGHGRLTHPSGLSIWEEGGNGSLFLVLPIFISFPQVSLSTAGKSFSESKIPTATSSNLLLPKKEKEKVKDRDRDREKSKDPKQVMVPEVQAGPRGARAPSDNCRHPRLWAQCHNRRWGEGWGVWLLPGVYLTPEQSQTKGPARRPPGISGSWLWVGRAVSFPLQGAVPHPPTFHLSVCLSTCPCFLPPACHCPGCSAPQSWALACAPAPAFTDEGV